MTHDRDLTVRVIKQTGRRVICGEQVPSADKIFSLCGPHTAIVVKGFGEAQHGHTVHLSSEVNGFSTAWTIEKGSPGDKTLLLPVLDYYHAPLGKLPRSVVADGGCASQANVAAAP